MLQAGNLQIRFLIRSTDFINLPHPWLHFGPAVYSSSKKMSTMTLPEGGGGVQVRSARKAANLTTSSLRLETLWTSTACNKHSVTYLP
jgi:hypothetical protein